MTIGSELAWSFPTRVLGRALSLAQAVKEFHESVEALRRRCKPALWSLVPMDVTV